MRERASVILDPYGKPIVHRNGKPRPEMAEAFARAAKAKQVRARYDAAQTTDDNKNYWAAADTYDADSANSKAVRSKLVSRSRYEVGNNGYADGIAQTYATDLVGTGPKLRMQSGSVGFNRLVEFWWDLWAGAIQLRRKLWCQAHAKHTDGEGFGVARTNPRIRNPVQLDYVLYETEQFQTPYLPLSVGYIDGLRFDEFGNPEYWDLLTQHPGGGQFGLNLVPERVPARYVMQWFLLRRPGQHRGVPESSSTLNSGAAARRWREATLAAAETAADFSVLLKTAFQPDEVSAMVPMDTQEIQKRMMTALPQGWDASQMTAEHPNATYEGFHKTLINEQARPKSMPFNKAACDSSKYNYASGRLDHQTYYAALNVDRQDGNDLVLNPLFDLWFDEAIRVFSWLGGNPNAIGPSARLHQWDWPRHPTADVVSEANAAATKLKSGQVFLHQLYSEMGLDFEDEIDKAAASMGIPLAELQRAIFTAIYNAQGALSSQQFAEAATQQASDTTPSQPADTEP